MEKSRNAVKKSKMKEEPEMVFFLLGEYHNTMVCSLDLCNLQKSCNVLWCFQLIRVRAHIVPNAQEVEETFF